MVMAPEAWTVVGTGVVVLIAIATAYRYLRGEMNQIHAEVGEPHERMAKREGLLEGLREAITGPRSPDRRAGRRRYRSKNSSCSAHGPHCLKMEAVSQGILRPEPTERTSQS